MPRPFKTYRQQLKILRDRGLIINDGSKAIRILEREQYYALINGYKDLFLTRDVNGCFLTPETYLHGVKFEEIYSLFIFDRELRAILLKYILMFESSLKSKVAYVFSEAHRERNAYLQLKNFSSDPAKQRNILKLIVTLSQIMHNQSKSKNAVGHYLDNHDNVPLWVLINYCSFGNMGYFYDCMEESLQNKVAFLFAQELQREYKIKHHFTPNELSAVITLTNYFRNVCAHEERLYNFKVHSKLPKVKFPINNVINGGIYFKRNLFNLVFFLKFVLQKKEYNNLRRDIKNLFYNTENQFHSIKFDDIIKEMGFDTNWQNDLL